MALFQKTVIKKHLLDANSTEVDAAYQRFSAYFHDSVRQQNIRNSKEEQFQEGFLRELFGHIFGYTLNPEPNFNLTTELKNTSNSKKVDGAIVFDGKAIAVIELKGTNTTDLNSIETQAFGYKNNQPECVYVITSNFEKLRFYIDNSIDYEEFNLFTLSREQFNLLYLCLSLPSIQQNLPKRLKDESVSQEDAITKKLYKDYSEFKRALYHNLVELNPEFDKLLLFKKTQKLLDRFLFIFFAEDRLLLPTNLIFRINQEWKNLMKMRMTVSLYERYKVYFNDLNVGAKVTLPAFGKKTGDAIEAEFEIFAYNGGLFVPDEVLDNVKIDDEVLHVYTEKMSHYDFDSDVDVNILGHIFENSLNEIDEIKSEIEGETVDKTKTRRKKDGVFYTPKYITKYIVDNTVGKLCAEKKAALNLADEDYTNDKKIQTKTKKAHLDKLTDYRAWLLQLTICDPACGSGAFLNQALEFLIAEHRYVDELQAKLMGDSMILSDVETSILENNIYGVDLNDESVEIAKLSLWLRTAQKGRKLNSLNNNIKCGNSLIDDPEVAGNKAFYWEKEFPQVFEKGGFDIIIGNPPYVSNWTLSDNDKEMVSWLSEKYKKDLTGHWDLFVCFISISLNYLKKSGYNSFILPTSFLKEKYGKLMRENIITNYELIEIVDFG
jgi:type I restriction-modification system DNA methylase subunit